LSILDGFCWPPASPLDDDADVDEAVDCCDAQRSERRVAAEQPPPGEVNAVA
jgi:hypothetical protein